MIIKKLAKNLLPPIVVNAANYAIGSRQQKKNEQMLQKYLQNGKVPWSARARLGGGGSCCCLR
ncbi:MAG: hypothetical protein WBG73_16150 [Coleofasciculaceae cyanobacterium]